MKMARCLMAVILMALCILASMSTSSWAASVEISTSGLTDEQKAELAVKIAEMQKKAKEPPTAEKVNQWVDVGKNVGAALVAAAKEVGVAADQFLQSTTGKITMAMIIWKVMGKDLVGLVVGLGILLSFVSLWVYFFRRMCILKKIRVDYPNEGFKRIKHFEYYGNGECDGTRFVMFIVLAMIVSVSLLVIF